jgi:membrane-bound lytic murein transglycosylase B
MKKILFLVSCLLSLSAIAGEFDYDRWNEKVESIKDRAVAEGVSESVVKECLSGAGFIPHIVNRDRNQAEFKMTLDNYRTRTVSQKRIAEGRAMRGKHAQLLARTEQKYEVPRHVLLAFWGLESSYGADKARHVLCDSFMTLIYEGRREKFFTDQMVALLKISHKNNLPPRGIRGSWAGAMGHFQFIPTTLIQYGADGNGDGRVDIIESLPDAFASAGNFLNKLGWNKSERIARRVVLPQGFDESLCDSKEKRTLSEWSTMGLANMDLTPLPNADMNAGIVCDLDNMQAYLTYPNFYRIKKWNNSNWYAIAVHELSEALKK